MNQQSALTYSSILQSLYWNDIDNLTMAISDRDAASAQLAAVAAVQDAFDAAMVAANMNGDLSAQGRGSALLAASKRSLMALCESGQDNLARVAIENAPFEPLLPAIVIAQGRAIRGARSLPDLARSLETASNLRALLGASVTAARRHTSLSVSGTDPLQVANDTAAEMAEEE